MPPPSLPRALRDLFDHELALHVAIDRHFGPTYRQRTNGVWDDREAFRRHVEHLRTFVRSVEVEGLDEMLDGGHYAERHVVHLTKTDGTAVVQEVFVFATVDPDGRFTTVDEVTLMLAGDEADRAIGNAQPRTQ